MLKLQVDFGDETRTVMTNIGNRAPGYEKLVGYQFPFIMNLKPAKIMGVESTAMIMIVENENGTIVFQNTNYPNGSKLL
jgi:tRNA-binding EMAP/Myf-like protein